MTITRLKVLKYYLLKKTNVTLTEFSHFFFSPSYKTIANRFIQKIEQDDQYSKIYFKGIDDPMFYPSDFNRHSLDLVVVECFDSHNWHYYEIPQTRVAANEIVVDGGAAEGLFALKIQKRCKQVYLIEPLTKFVQSLEKTFVKADNIKIIPFAISDKEFSTRIISNDISSALSDVGEGEKVEVTTLDKIFFDKQIPVSYLKMDLEGHDYKAILGAENLIKHNKPKIVVTTYHVKEHATQIEQFLKSIVPEYNILCKGIYQETGSPVMLHAWV